MVKELLLFDEVGNISLDRSLLLQVTNEEFLSVYDRQISYSYKVRQVSETKNQIAVYMFDSDIWQVLLFSKYSKNVLEFCMTDFMIDNILQLREK